MADMLVKLYDLPPHVGRELRLCDYRLGRAG